jgi:hypothetical protein
MEAREIARMIVRQAPEQAIRDRTIAYLGQYVKMDSQTEGAEAQAAAASVEVMKEQAQKEIWESERQKAEQLTEAQREQIRKMLDMIEEMMKLQSDQSDTTLSR